MNHAIDRGPTRVGSAFALLAGLIAAMAAIAYSGVAALIGVSGLLLLALGLLLPRPSLITTGAAGLIGGVLLAGLAGGAPAILLPGTIGAVLAWDVGHNAASHGRQVGARVMTIRAEGVHALGSMLAGIVAASVGYGIYATASAGQPVTAVALLAVASVLLVLAIK